MPLRAANDATDPLHKLNEFTFATFLLPTTEVRWPSTRILRAASTKKSPALPSGAFFP